MDDTPSRPTAGFTFFDPDAESDPAGMSDRDRKAIEQPARTIRTTYVNCRRRSFPRYVMDFKTWGPDFWFKQARKLLQNRVEPISFVEVQFDRIRPYPTPNMLTTPAGFEYFKLRFGDGSL